MEIKKLHNVQIFMISGKVVYIYPPLSFCLAEFVNCSNYNLHIFPHSVSE